MVQYTTKESTLKSQQRAIMILFNKTYIIIGASHATKISCIEEKMWEMKLYKDYKSIIGIVENRQNRRRRSSKPNCLSRLPMQRMTYLKELSYDDLANPQLLLLQKVLA
jgi:hypothetical protein